MKDGAQFATRDPLAQCAHRGPEAATCPTASTTPAFRQASNIRTASAWRSARGFSQNTCFLAVAQAITCAGCNECGVASKTASIVRSARTVPDCPSTRADVPRKGLRAFDVGLTAPTIFSPLMAERRLDEVAAPAADADDSCPDRSDSLLSWVGPDGLEFLALRIFARTVL